MSKKTNDSLLIDKLQKKFKNLIYNYVEVFCCIRRLTFLNFIKVDISTCFINENYLELSDVTKIFHKVIVDVQFIDEIEYFEQSIFSNIILYNDTNFALSYSGITIPLNNKNIQNWYKNFHIITMYKDGNTNTLTFSNCGN